MKKGLRIGEVLVANNFLSKEDLHLALQKQKEIERSKVLGEILLEEGLISEEHLLYALSKQFGHDIVDLYSYKIEPALVEQYPFRLLRSSLILPFKEDPESIYMAIGDSTQYQAMETIERMSGSKEVRWYLAKKRDILHIFNRLEINRSIEGLLKEVKREISEVGIREEDEESAAMRLVRLFMRDAILRGASDLHIEPDSQNARVRARIDGILHETFTFDLDIYHAVNSLVKIMGNLDISERRRSQDGRFEMMIDGKHYDFRLSTVPTMFGESLVMRILEQEKVLLGIQDLGFDKETIRMFEEAIHQPYGFVLVTGPTGSGKSTTLYAALNEIKTLENKVVTLEDPVEYRLPLVQQVQVNEKIEFGFSEALRSFLRQDPDVIMVGEIRDYETLEISAQAAMTGHLLLSTIHSNDTVSTINRMVQMGLPSYLIADSLLLILSQRLVRRICPYCKEEVKPPKAMLMRLKQWLPTQRELHFYGGKGCAKCEHSGYMGRTVIAEVLHIDRTIAQRISEGATKQEIERVAIESKKLRPIIFDGLRKVLAGVTTLEELLRVTRSL